MKRAVLIACLAAMGTISFQASAQDRVFTDPNGFQAEETPGGYEPADPPVPPGTPADARIVAEASISPSAAYPAPAPAKFYPACSASRRDNCAQRR